jgi:hypothetical protein
LAAGNLTLSNIGIQM